MPVLQGPRTTVSSAEHRKYPYLLRDFPMERPNQVWCSDITYVPMPLGFMYLAATMDWHSRRVISWRLSYSLEGSFCQAMLEDALSQATPTIFNTDQGVQFTTQAWTSRLESAGVQVSRNGRGRCHENIFVERLWRSVKTELSVELFASRDQARQMVFDYLEVFYNRVRRHSSLGSVSPAEFERTHNQKLR